MRPLHRHEGCAGLHRRQPVQQATIRALCRQFKKRASGGRHASGTAVVTVMLSLAGLTAHGQGQVGQFQDSGDVGSPALAGTTAYNPVTQSYALSAGGTNMWANRDEFQFAWRKLSGDFILQAQIAFVGAGVDPHRKAGLIIRSTIEADSPYADAVIHGDGLTSLQFRRTKGVDHRTDRVSRQGCGRRPDRAKRLDLRHVGREVRPAVHDVTGRRSRTRRRCIRRAGAVLAQSCRRRARDLLECPHHPPGGGQFSAVSRLHRQRARGARRHDRPPSDAVDVTSSRSKRPNWTRDGALIVNTSGTDADWRGRLHRFDLATRQSTVIDTGERIRNNNDHVLSPDGKTLAISDQSLQGVGSTIYTAAGDRRRAEAHHDARALVHAQLVARRQVARLHRRPHARPGPASESRHLSHRLRRQRSGEAPDDRSWRG